MKYLIKYKIFESSKSTKGLSNKEKTYLKIAPSTIPNSGNGLFTTKDIKKGESICKFTGDIITDEELVIRDTGGERSSYFIGLSNGDTLDVYKSKCFARYANDAEGFTKVKGRKNNSKIYSSDDNKSAYICATRNIKSGEEIFTSYGKEYWKNIH